MQIFTIIKNQQTSMQNTTYAGDQPYGQSFKPEMELEKIQTILSFPENLLRL